jgi:hypothetical protein
MPFLDALEFGASTALPDNSTPFQDLLDAAAAAIAAGAPRVWAFVPAGTYDFSTTLTYASQIVFCGAGSQATRLRFLGIGFAFESATPGVRTFNQRFERFELDFGADAHGIHLDDVSLAHFDDVAIFGPGASGSAIRVSGTVNGNAVYNAFYHCRMLSCGIGYDLAPSGSNDTHIIDCRATNCVRGVSIVDSNHAVVITSAIEGCETAIHWEAAAANIADALTVIGNRFEGNTNNIVAAGTPANLRSANIKANHHVDGTPYVDVDLTVFPNVSGDTGTAQAREYITSALFSTDGTPFSKTRTTPASSAEPMQVFADVNEGSGAATTLQIRGGRSAGHGISIGRVTAGAFAERFSVANDGTVETLAGVRVAADLTFTGTSSQVFFGDGIAAGNTGLTWNKADANNVTFANWQVAGQSRWAEQFNSTEDIAGLIFDNTGALQSIRPYTKRYAAVNGRAGMAFCRMWCDLGTTVSNANFALVGLGGGASISIEGGSRDMRGEFKVTVGAAPAANPTITLTFANGAWPSFPFGQVTLVGGTGYVAGTITRLARTLSATQLTVMLLGTPLAGQTYVVAWSLMG